MILSTYFRIQSYIFIQCVYNVYITNTANSTKIRQCTDTLKRTARLYHILESSPNLLSVVYGLFSSTIYQNIYMNYYYGNKTQVTVVLHYKSWTLYVAKYMCLWVTGLTGIAKYCPRSDSFNHTACTLSTNQTVVS